CDSNRLGEPSRVETSERYVTPLARRLPCGVSRRTSVPASVLIPYNPLRQDRPMRTSLKFVLALMAGAATASPVAAQLSSNIDASATVLAALSVTGDLDLTFGNIAPTQSKVVGAAAGGHFSVSGASGASV